MRARVVAPGQTVEQFLKLDLDLEEGKELATVWWISARLLSILNLRSAGKRIENYLVRAQLEAKINLLRETRFAEATQTLENLLSNFEFCIFEVEINKDKHQKYIKTHRVCTVSSQHFLHQNS